MELGFRWTANCSQAAARSKQGGSLRLQESQLSLSRSEAGAVCFMGTTLALWRPRPKIVHGREQRWVLLAASVHRHLAVVKMCPIYLWPPPNAPLSFSTIHKRWMPETGISAALLLLVSLAWGECWAQVTSVLFTNLLTIYVRSLFHKARAKAVSMGWSWANSFSDCMGMGFPFRLGQEIARLVPNTQCAAENKESVNESGTPQCFQALLCRLEGNWLGFGSGKRDPVSSQMTYLCLKLKSTKIPYPELQGTLPVLVKKIRKASCPLV